MVRGSLAFSDHVECCAEAIDRAATDTTIAEFDRVAAVFADEPSIDIDLADIVHDHGDGSVGGAEQLIDQRGFTCAQVPSHEGQRYSPAVPRQELWFLITHQP